MIILWEGISGCGKTTLIKELITRYPKIACYYKAFDASKYQPMINTNKLIGRSFQDVVFADLLRDIPLKSEILCFDRSLISGKVYHNFWLNKGFSGDPTWRNEYIEFYFDCLHNGINRPVIIFYILADINICRQRTERKGKKFYDEECSKIFPKVLHQWGEKIFKLRRIPLITLINNTEEDKKFNMEVIQKTINKYLGI